MAMYTWPFLTIMGKCFKNRAHMRVAMCSPSESASARMQTLLYLSLEISSDPGVTPDAVDYRDALIRQREEESNMQYREVGNG